MSELETMPEMSMLTRGAKKRREPTGGNLHTGKWHAWCRNESHVYA